jgi:hypothetical protein
LILDDVLSSGGQHYCAVYHVLGMDWCAYTDIRAKTALDGYGATPARLYKELLFGGAVAGGVYAHDDIQWLGILNDNLGKQKISYDEKKGIKTGFWNVSLHRGPSGYTYENGTQECWGLPGLDWIIDVGQDGTVARGRLAADFEGSGNLSWDSDEGLFDRIDNAVAPFYLWIGSTCVMVPTGTPSESNGVYTHGVVGEAFHAPAQRVYKDTTAEQERIEILDIPCGESIAGLPAHLWLIPLDADGGISGFDTSATLITDHEAPILFRIGQVSTNPSGTPAEWKITHTGFSDMLKAKIGSERFTAQVQGYQFSRSGLLSQVSSQYPHIGVVEVYHDGSNVKVNTAQLWLCSASSYVRYENYSDLAEAVVDAMNASGSLTLGYQSTGDDITYYRISGTKNDSNVYVYGPAALALGLGYVRGTVEEWHANDVAGRKSRHTNAHVSTVVGSSWGIAGEEFTDFNQMLGLRDNYWQEPIFIYEHTDEAFSDNTFSKVDPVEAVRNNSRCSYFIQFDWADPAYYSSPGAGTYDGDSTNGQHGHWQIPEDGSSNRYLYLGAESDALLLKDEDRVTFGDGLTDPEGYFIDGIVDGNPAAYNYILFDGTVTANPDLIPTQPSRQYVGQVGFSLYWAPGYQEKDPWVIADRRVIEGDTPAEIFRGLLGDSAALPGLPRRIPVTTIPDVKTSDNRTLIDWDAWEIFEGEWISVDFVGDEFPVIDAMTAFAFTHGYRLTWEYSETERSWILGLAPMAPVSAAQASAEGRVINTSVIIPEAPRDVISNGWLYSGVEVEVNTGPKTKLKVKASKKTGRTAHIAGAKILKVKDPISLFDETDTTLLNLMRKYAELFAVPVVNQKFKLIPNAMAKIAVGRGALVTWDVLMDSSTGRRSGDTKTALVVSETISVDKINVEVRIGRTQYGIAPSLFLANARISPSGTTLTLSGVETDPTNNDFASKTGGLTDFLTFDCYDYSTATGIVARNCTCSDYAVIIFERDTDDLTDAGGSRNVWHGTISVTNLTGDGVIELADATNFSTVHTSGSDFVVIFEDRDHASLQSCQTVYGWLGDSNGIVTDSSAATHRAITWG